MTLLALLLVGSGAAVGSAWGLARGGQAARAAATSGVLALAAMAVLAALSPTPSGAAADVSGSVPGALWNGALAAGAYARVAIVLWAVSSIVLIAMAWLLRGIDGLRGLLPATLGGLVGATVALTATSLPLGLVGAAAAGLASVPVVLTSTRSAAPGIAAREVRIAVAPAVVVLAVAAVAPIVSRLVLAHPDGAVAAAGSGVTAAVGFGLLSIAVVVAGRVGAIPYHVRISALTDSVPPGALPLVLAWLPLPLAAVAVGVVAADLAPMALPLEAPRTLIVVLTLLTTLAAALVAFIQDDLRHAVGYLTIADLGLVLFAFAALDPAVWGPARAWLLTAAVTKTALTAWVTVVEDRFETRAVPDLRGWVRPAPVLGLSLLLVLLATYGLPGWAVLALRGSLVHAAASGPWTAVLLIAPLLTLPAYLRWLWLGIGVPTSHVDRVAPEFAGLNLGALPLGRLTARPPIRRQSADLRLPVEHEETPKPEAAPLASWAAPDSATRDARGTEPAPASASRIRRGVAATPGPSITPNASVVAEAEPEAPPKRADRVERGSTIRVEVPPATQPATPAAEPEPAGANPETPELPPAPGDASTDRPDVRPGTGVGRRRSSGRGSSGSSPMAAERPPEASMELPKREASAAYGAARRRLPVPGPERAVWTATAVRQRRTGLLSAAVLALALLAALVAFGTLDVAGAAGEPTPAVVAMGTAGS